MSLNSSYITAVDLQETFVDKNTGLPLAGGQLRFWVDNARGVIPKVVYQLTGDPTDSQGDGYSYAPLPNPLTLSDVGTIVDDNGNNVPVYYYPYDANGDLEFYCVEIYGADGVLQATRPAWPSSAEGSGGGGGGGGSSTAVSENQITNSQFVDVSLGDNNTSVFTFVGAGSSSFDIGPGWRIDVTHDDNGTLTVQRTVLSGAVAVQTNPPYALAISPGANINTVKLVQRFEHNPGLLAQTTVANSGWISFGMILDGGNGVTADYVPSAGTPVLNFYSATNTTLSPAYFSRAYRLPQSTNTDDADVGYVDIAINLSPTSETIISSVQLTAAAPNTPVPYIEDTVNRQEDHLFHVYREPLEYKPIPSFLTGWDFRMNPAQCAAKDGTPTFGANGSGYIWDQTILFTQTSGSVNYQPSDLGTQSGPLRLLMTSTDNIALIQYLPLETARRMLSGPLSVMFSGNYSTSPGLQATVTLWYTSDATLPDLATNQSIVASVDNSGNVTSTNGTWTEIPRIQGNTATFTIAPHGGNETLYFQSGFNGWDVSDSSDIGSVTYFAIVVAIGQAESGRSVIVNSISVVPGDIPTLPAPQTLDAVFAECQQYYWKSYAGNHTEGSGTANGAVMTDACYILDSTLTNYYYPKSFYIPYPVTMWTIPDIRIYNINGMPDEILLKLITNGGSFQDHIIPLSAFDIIPFANNMTALNNWSVSPATTVFNYAEAYQRFQIVCDARLGLV